MSLARYSIIWPEVARIFPAHYANGTMPSDAEVQARINRYYALGDITNASRLNVWWANVPVHEKPLAGDIVLEPDPYGPPPAPAVQQAFERLSQETQAPEPPREPARPVRFRDFLVPFGVVIMVVGFLIASVTLNALARVESNGPDMTRFDRFPQEPVSVAEQAVAPVQPIAKQATAPVRSSSIFRNVHIYRVSDELVLSPNPTEDVARLWERTVAIFGDDAKRLKSFGVTYEGSETGAAGYLDIDGKGLVISLDGIMASREIQDYTLIHEYNHMVTLYEQEDVRGLSCSTSLILSGTVCLDSDSSLYRWIKQFWPDENLVRGSESGDMAAGESLYYKNPDDFVTVYAASAPQEDMAESFAAWVLNYEMPREKRMFFEMDGESVLLKERILKSLDRL